MKLQADIISANRTMIAITIKVPEKCLDYVPCK
ncbi:hypothetical protein SPFM9_00282 [Salmonella phage SPFM9]|nr:hypothetical protein SPFM9_00282 [Salmonella phage SPFM9]